MKIIIEHEQINATTTSLALAQKLLETIKQIEQATKFSDIPIYQDISECPKPKADKVILAEKFCKELPGELPRKDIFDTKDLSDIPAEVIKPKLPPFKPAWLEKHIDFNKSKIIRYSNPCSTLHGKCGQKCWQTELWTDTNGDLDTCDCEFYELDELTSVLNAYIKDSTPKTPKKQKHECHCSKERLQRVADLVNQGCSNKQIAERLGISPTSAATYKGDCKKLGMLN